MNSSNKRISASILSADFARLGEECQKVLKSGADRLHLDVMDNHYVPNLTFGPQICRALRHFGIEACIDVHLMTSPVDSLIIAFAKAGANVITFHPEASQHIDRSLQLIKDHGCLAGLAFNPATPLSYLEFIQEKIDEILIMSVNPGFGGQNFIQSSLKKIAAAKKMLPASISIAVDGGVKPDNIAEISKAGADIFIAGSAIFESPDYAQALSNLRRQLALT